MCLGCDRGVRGSVYEKSCHNISHVLKLGLTIFIEYERKMQNRVKLYNLGNRAEPAN